MSRALLLLLAVGFVYWLFTRPPSPGARADRTFVSIDESTLRYGDYDYAVGWGGEVTHAGDLRYFGRVFQERFEFFTHDAVLTTGEFSDPDKVKISPMRNGNTRWSSRSPKFPEGVFVALHFIPASRAVAEALDRLETGDSVELIGHEETDGRIERDDGAWLGLAHDNHRYLLVTEVRAR